MAIKFTGMIHSVIRSCTQKYLPKAASFYRFLRDRRLHSRQWFAPSAEGFDFIGDASFTSTTEESHELVTFKKHLEQVDAVIDIGANAGFFSLVAAKGGKPVTAVEPNLLNFEKLLKNIQKNDFNLIEPRFAAVGAERGVRSLFGGGQGASLLQNWGGMNNTYSSLVYCTTLDDLLRGRTSVERLLIKLDVEGAELLVLQGADLTLARHPSPIWIVEHGFDENFAGGINPNFRQLFQRFWQHDYSATTIEREPKAVGESDIDDWIRNRKRGFGWIYYCFSKRDPSGEGASQVDAIQRGAP